MTDDPGMRDMLSFLIARDTMHQQQWLAVIEELGGMERVLPIPNSLLQDGSQSLLLWLFQPHEGWHGADGPLDGKGQFEPIISTPLGDEPVRAKPRPDSGAQAEQIGMAPQPGPAR